MTLEIDVLTLFPTMVSGPLGESIPGRIQERGLATIRVHDLRKWGLGRHRSVDDTPYGGGAGMVMRVEPVVAAIESVRRPDSTVILLDPVGEVFRQARAADLSTRDHLVFVCPRYEGVDDRIRAFVDLELSIGDYVVTGGELPALVVIDAVIRLLPGAIDDLSTDEESFQGGLLEYPQYTRPPTFRGMDVPEILTSGDHGAVARWRVEQATARTRERRPDLLRSAEEGSVAMDAATAGSLLELAEAASAGATGPAAKASLARLEEHLDDLLAAIAWFVGAGRTDEALRLASALYRFWITKQRFEEGAVWFDRVLAAPGGDDRLRGKASLHAGFMPFWLGDDERAAALFGESLEIGRRLGDPPMISQALGGLARVALRTDVAEGRRLAGEALTVSEAAADEPGRSNALHLLGVGAQIAGDLPEARDWMTQRLTLVRSMGNDFLVASEASNLSMVERQLGNLDDAETLAREALEIGGRIGDEFTKPFAISGLAAIATERGEFERAATLLGAAEAIMEAQHMAWPPDERPHYERMLAVLPEAMGLDAFEPARARGRSMSATEAVEFALA